MRVAVIIPRLAELGPVKVIQALVNSLSETAKLQINVYYLDSDVDQNLKMKVPVEKLNRRNFRFSDFDIIHTNGIRPDLFAFLNRKKIKYHISTIHNFVFEDLSYSYCKLISLIFGNIWLLLWRRADKLVGVSEELRKYYEKWYSSSKLEVIYNGITEPDNLNKPDSDVIQVIENFRSRGVKVMGSSAILTKGKGMDQVLYLLEKVNDLAFIIIGNGREHKRLQKLAGKLKISDRCHFCGMRSGAVNYFKNFDFLVMPSRSEGFGLTLVEAVQQKVPVICSDIPVFRELFNENEVSFFKLEDIDSLATALRNTAKSGSKKATLAYIKYQNNYTAMHMAKRYLELYQSAS